MKIRLFTLLGAVTFALVLAASTAQARAADPGSGTCPSPWMQDADGDGIPNGLDPDYVPPMDGTGNKFQRGAVPASAGNTVANQWQNQWREMLGGRLGELVGMFGFGPGTGTGVCDGTGPKGFGGFGRR